MVESITIQRAFIETYEHPFNREFSLLTQHSYQRQGIYLHLESKSGQKVSSEIAPLFGFSEESFEKASYQIREILARLNDYQFPLNREDLLHHLREEEWLIALSASVRFGVVSALCLLAARHQGKSLIEFLGGHFNEGKRSAALLQGDRVAILNQGKKYYAQGYRVFKLKVGNRNIAFDVLNVNDLRALGKDVRLRLDANRQWKLEEAVCFAQLIGPENIEFIEEPLINMDGMASFYEQTQMPIALDETLLLSRQLVKAPGRCQCPLVNHQGVKMLVLKPMLLGFMETLDWIAFAQTHQQQAMISSCFEHKIGLSILAHLSFLTPAMPGLATSLWFDDTADFLGPKGEILKEHLC